MSKENKELLNLKLEAKAKEQGMIYKLSLIMDCLEYLSPHCHHPDALGFMFREIVDNLKEEYNIDK